MINLLTVELKRMLSRRMVWFVMIATIALVVFSGVMTFIQTADDRNYNQTVVQDEVERCAREQFGRESGIPLSERRAECRAMLGGDPRFQYTDVEEVLLGSSPPFLIIAFLFGASFIGAEWHHGTITTTLTWDPRRIRVLAVKALVAAAFCAVAFVFLQVFLAAVLYPAAAAHGTTSGIDAQWIRDVTSLVLRGALLAAICSTIGLAIASVGRNTTAALGVMFVYFVAFEQIVRALRPGWTQWLFVENTGLFISGDPTNFPQVSRSVAEAAVLLILYAAALLVFALLWFRRRDVT
jgi:ABC-type transport system involved in multi-copper enzyme maturation permease subunit